MSRTPLHQRFLNWEGTLEKLSSNPFLGFQPRVWKILESGSRIGYRLPDQTVFLPDKTFPLASCSVEEVEDEKVFVLHTPKKTFKLRTENEVSCKDWMRAVTQLRKHCLRSIRPVSPPHKPLIGNDSTLPSIGIAPIQQPRARQNSALQIAQSRRASRVNSPLIIGDTPSDLSELVRRMPSSFAYYHILSVKLRRRGEMADTTSHHYILFSSKSLLPEEYISEENLNSSQLPHWAEVDIFFRLGQQSHNSREIFNLAAVEGIEDIQTHCALRIITGKEKYQFDCEGLEARRKLKEILEIGRANAVETAGTEGTRNYDALVALHALNLEEFNLKVGLMLAPLLPSEHRFEPKVLPMVVDGLAPLLLGVVEVLERKQPIPRETIIDFVKLMHEEVRVHLKLVWDTSHSFIKSGEILAILKAISKYQILANPYIKDPELIDGLKELSKLAARACYKQMEPLILTLVSQQRNNTYFVEPSQLEEEQGLLQTHAVTDLFKLLYEIYSLALPSWNSKLHLHNLHRLVRRCLSVFVTQMRALVDEEDLQPEQLAALANDYLRFSEEVESFYEDRLSDLQEQTREHYSQLRDDYREVSLLVVEKLLLPLRLKLRLHFEQQTFFVVALEQSYKLIVGSPLKQLLPSLHPIFQKRCLQALFTLLGEEICRLLEKEAGGKKKPPLDKVLMRLEALRKDLVEMRQLLGKIPLKAQKGLSELTQLLTTARKEEAKLILSQLPEKSRKSYLKILNLRSEYTPGSPFYAFLQTLQDVQLNASPSSSSPRRRSSLPKAYLQQWDRGSISSVEREQLDKGEKEEKVEEKVRMISEGWVMRGRAGSSYERIYLRLKKGVLYVYADNQSERCQNTLQIEDITEISHPHPEKPVFSIKATVLGRSKEMKLQCPQGEDAARWVFSLQGEMRRVGNDRKMKWKGMKGKEKRSKLIIDYMEAEMGPDYFSYAE